MHGYEQMYFVKWHGGLSCIFKILIQIQDKSTFLKVEKSKFKASKRYEM
jgi:hypothetical protein